MEQKKNNNKQSEKQQNSEKRAFNKMSLLAEAMRDTFLYIHFSLFGVTNTTKGREFIPAFTPNLFSDDYFDNSRFGALLSIPYSLYYSIFKGIITKKSTVLISYYF